MFIERSGEGANLILLHGWAMNHYCWHRLIPVLEKRYTTIRVDLPGHGDGCGSCFSFSRADELIAELSNLCEEGATWIGWSLGGLLAQRVAEAYPHKVKRLICVGSAACYMQMDGWPEGVSEKDFNHFLKIFEADRAFALEHFLTLQVIDSENAKDTLKILRLLSVGNYEPKELTAALELLRTQDMRKAIANYKCPVLFMGGKTDKLVSTNSLKASSMLAPQGKVDIIEKAGHAPMISHFDDFANRLAEYLDRTYAYK